ncbi:MAG: hypothetical protein ACR2OJ_07025, partial [Hyphomicrobiales bacterium]
DWCGHVWLGDANAAEWLFIHPPYAASRPTGARHTFHASPSGSRTDADLGKASFKASAPVSPKQPPARAAGAFQSATPISTQTHDGHPAPKCRITVTPP